jgi:hypothetical protein
LLYFMVRFKTWWLFLVSGGRGRPVPTGRGRTLSYWRVASSSPKKTPHYSSFCESARVPDLRIH